MVKQRPIPVCDDDDDALETRERTSLSPEARRRRHQRAGHAMRQESRSFVGHVKRTLGPGTRPFEIAKRTLVGTYQDGFIHAGNLAYLAMIAIFPFFILAGALFQLVGEVEDRRIIIETVLLATPPTVRSVIEPVATSVIDARTGWLLWLGAGAALWSVSSLIETIRDVLRRAYGTKAVMAFWRARLASAGLIIGAVVLLLLSLFAQVAIGAAQQFIIAWVPQLAEATGSLDISRLLPAAGLFLSLWLLFVALAPIEYRAKTYPKWPGAAITTVWWFAVTTALPPILSQFFVYDLTYGSLAGIMVALFFFWLVGLGVVIGAELNAALAEPEADTDQGDAG
ncbi:MAG: YihY/virulence factor BrkB family protein [Erythrobacter sp.]|nr:YihY/virulence factor BrkB family protein [Erythrobacter sp.]